METKSDIQNMVPFKATHPGTIIREELEYLGVKHKDFAILLGMQPTHFSSLLNGKRNLSADIALRIEQHTGLKAEQLMLLQVKYEIDCIRIKQRCQEELIELSV